MITGMMCVCGVCGVYGVYGVCFKTNLLFGDLKNENE